MEIYVQTILIGLSTGLVSGMLVFVLNLGARKVLSIIELVQ